MSEQKITDLLEAVARGEISPTDAMVAMQSLRPTEGYADLGHTKVDTDRRRRRGVAEAVYAANKTSQQVLEIIERIDAARQNVVCTRVPEETAAFVMAARNDIRHHPAARMLTKVNEPRPVAGGGVILVMCAGTSDIPVAEEAALSAEMMGSEVDRVYDVGVAGIHRLFGAAANKMQTARVVIVAAGMEGALPSVVAGLTSAPVIAVPTSVGYGASFGGVAALLGMLNSCSGGIAVVNIDNGFGAGLMAHLINRAGCLPATPEN
ncbi:1-(5-phosphoribosyl)-5-amino-4-imidazole-carboxylate carboxylase [candidate division BRC1 bacterium HGW-BRC1-1]|jgi:hypothetical protein|nr:MAG: 1-(5-phosphoribosyl)-5-amino-4-imidazole-carboxylate carboxylase [candidate division BRC1 bacterium HGW-BRC1-1]